MKLVCKQIICNIKFSTKNYLHSEMVLKSSMDSYTYLKQYIPQYFFVLMILFDDNIEMCLHNLYIPFPI